MKRLIFLSASIIALLSLNCCKHTVSVWSESSSWYQNGKETDLSKPDLFYLVSTEVMKSTDENGNPSLRAALTPEERAAYDAEFAFIDRAFGDSLNLFAPYYHEYTVDAFVLPDEELDSLYNEIITELVEAFRYYLDNLNGGRPFVIAGFSQGGMYIPDLVEIMDEREYARFAAGYQMGCRLREEDLAKRNVKAAESADDTGVIVSFNSVADTSAVWDFINGGAVTCINPVNWTTDSTPATFVFNSDTLEVRVDYGQHTLVVDGTNPEKYSFPMLEQYCKPGNLHHWDLMFYNSSLKRNALHRVSLIQ